MGILGLRSGEALGLASDNVDLTSGVFRVERALPNLMDNRRGEVSIGLGQLLHLSLGRPKWWKACRMEPAQLTDPHAVTTNAELEAAIGVPDERVKLKQRTEIDDTAQDFIERSPFIVVATCDADGRLDASPKGDPPGFVHVIDPTTLAIPERKGNALGFGPRNVLATGRIGLIFMVPGQRETYRVNGTAHLTRDPELLDRLAVTGKPALMATVVGVEEAFFHCGKAMIRAALWAAPDESEAERTPIAEQIGKLMGDDNLVPVVAADLEQNYRDGLY